MTESRQTTVATPSRPVTPMAMVRRTRLLTRLDGAPDAKVITLVAPGGFGKSTLLSQWLADSGRRVVWLSMPTGADSRDVAERIAVELASGPISGIPGLPVVQDDALWFSVVLPALEDRLSRQLEPFVLVLDDAMNLSDKLSDSLIEGVAASIPQGSQLVLCTRGAPPHAVRRLRTTGRTLELNAADLAMDDDEARLLLEELTVHLPDDQLAQVVLRTEGWPVGIYLLGRAVLSDPDLLATDEVPLASTEWIYDYIRDELFAELDPEDATFLMRVSVLDDLTGPACDAVSGVTGSLGRLRELSAENQLIRRSSGVEVSYGLHQLLGDFLREELRGQPDQDFERTHARAAEWFTAHGRHDQAVSHLRRAGDDAALGDFVWGQAWRLLPRGRMPVMRRWITGIEDDRIAGHPGLSLSAAWIGTQEGDMAKVMRYTALARDLVANRGIPGRYPTHVTITEAVIGADGIESIIGLTSAVLDGGDRTDPWMSLALFLRGVAYLHVNKIDEGVADLAEGSSLAEALQVTHVRALCLAALATVRLALGDSQEAGELVARARRVVFDNNLEHIPTGAPIFTASALVLLETGQRAEAAADAARALRTTILIESIAPWHAVEGRLRLAQVYRGLGDADRARVLTTEARDRYTAAAHSPLLDGMLTEAEAQVVQSNGTGLQPSLLTTAELRVVQYLPSHLTFPEIGAQLWLSRHTVKSQAMSAYRKLGVTSRGEAVARARELGLLPTG